MDIEQENMYGALSCDDDDHDDHDLNPSTPLVAPTIVKAIDDAMAMAREQALGALGGWAEVKGPRKAKSPNHPNASRVITVENEQDLSKIFGLPSGPQSDEARIAATQFCLVDKSLKPCETYCMMDSGAGCNAADAKKEFGAYRVQNVNHKQQCVLANGTEITSNGICNVTALVKGEERLIPFKDLPVE